MTSPLHETDSSRITTRTMRGRLLDCASVALYLVVLSVICWRMAQHWPETDAPATGERWALASYRDAIYYPLQAVTDGVNPYDSVQDSDPNRYMQRYPVGDHFPLYSPLTLLLHAPFAALSLNAGMICFLVLQAFLIVLFAWIVLHVAGQNPSIAAVFLVAALLLATQPGRAAFNSGQVSFLLAIAIVGVLHWASRAPGCSAWSLAVATLKPTFGGPLALLMAARGDWRTAGGGLLLGGTIALLGAAAIFGRAGDTTLVEARHVIEGNLGHFHQDPEVVIQTNRARVDLAASVEYLLHAELPRLANLGITLGVQIVSGLALWLGRTDRPGDAASLSSTFMILAMLVCYYHNVYDLPLLALPLAAVALGRIDLNSNALRWTLLMLLAVPFVNCFWTAGFVEIVGRWSPTLAATLDGGWFSRLASATNGLALTAAWCITGFVLIRRTPGPRAVVSTRNRNRQLLKKHTHTEPSLVAISPTNIASTSLPHTTFFNTAFQFARQGMRP